MKIIKYILAISAIILINGCASTIPKEALALTSSSLEERQLQSRIYEDVTEQQVLSAGVHIFQDLGAKITETETDLGLIVGEKDRDAVEAGQVATVIFAALLGVNAAYDTNQKIKFSLVTTPVKLGQDDKRWIARLTIQRLVWNSHNQLSKIEAVKDEEVYQAFFEKMNKALFLETNS
ncbi:hypothetical protein K0504_16765 [Neiella marina]|uniref:Lipoprotein n=1 Tax=Neiella holothuriorum TaxID=2870530 RepID=A0ABS7EK36_9GAMM|nr:hypothetical protein [Neiella holothuriorum]MBW8192691.1 hypothetical protein [Neiella holothuriorum]